MIKRKISISLAVIIIFTSLGSNFSYGDKLDYYNPGEEDLIKDQVEYIRLNKLAERFHLDLGWDKLNRLALMDQGRIKIQPNSREVLLEGEKILLENQVRIKENNIFVPYEFVDRVLGLNISASYETFIAEKPGENFKYSQDERLKINMENYLNSLVKASNFYGAVLVSKGDEILYDGAYGYSSLGENILNSKETSFGIGSMTKQFVASSILKLREEGKISLEDSLDKYFPDYKYGKDIKIKNLLNHSSGIVGFTDQVSFLEMVNKKTQEDMYSLIADKELHFKPGQGFRYSNSNYLILGMIVEDITGNSLESYIEENFLNKLDMKSTGLSYEKNSKYPMATPYTGFLDVNFIDDEYLLRRAYGAGNMYSNIYDIYKWYLGLKSGQVLSEESLKLLVNEDLKISKAGDYYGYGIMVHEDRDLGKYYSHNGNTFGFTSVAGYIPAEEIFITILSNKGHQDLDSIFKDLGKISLNKEYETREEIKEVEISPEDLEKYRGDYILNIMGQEVKTKVTIDNGLLYIQLEGQEAFPVYYMGKDKFFYKIVDAKVEFKMDQGRAKGIVLEQMGFDYFGEREDLKLDGENLELKKYVGKYISKEGIRIEIFYDQGLYVDFGQGRVKITENKDGSFRIKGINIRLHFKADNTGFSLVQGGREFDFIRTD